MTQSTGVSRYSKSLRPHLTLSEFARRLCIQAQEGYHVACIETQGEGLAALGYRVLNFLAWGRVLYIDDLITHPHRKKRGFGGALMDWAIDQARQLECDAVHLDTGFTRHDAHRLYLNKSFTLHCHHLEKKLK